MTDCKFCRKPAGDCKCIDLDNYDAGMDEYGLPLHGKHYGVKKKCRDCYERRMILWKSTAGAVAKPKMCGCAFRRYISIAGQIEFQIQIRTAGMELKDAAERQAARAKYLLEVRANVLKEQGIEL